MSRSPSDGGTVASAAASTTAQIRVFLCDDAVEFCELMRHAIDAQPGMSVVGEASSGRACVAAIGRLRPDVILLDLAMDDNPRDGLWALPRIRAAVPDSRVIVVSAFPEERMADRARAAGAHDYIEKGAPLNRIIGAVREAFPDRDRPGRFRQGRNG